jgi:hypothetical protein
MLEQAVTRFPQKHTSASGGRHPVTGFLAFRIVCTKSSFSIAPVVLSPYAFVYVCNRLSGNERKKGGWPEVTRGRRGFSKDSCGKGQTTRTYPATSAHNTHKPRPSHTLPPHSWLQAPRHPAPSCPAEASARTRNSRRRSTSSRNGCRNGVCG